MFFRFYKTILDHSHYDIHSYISRFIYSLSMYLCIYLSSYIYRYTFLYGHINSNSISTRTWAESWFSRPVSKLLCDCQNFLCLICLPGNIFSQIPAAFFPKAAAKGSFKKSAVIKHCYQTLPKVLLKWWLSWKIVIKDCPKFCWSDGCL